MRNDIVNNIRLDVNREKNKAVIYVRAGDTKSRTVHFTIVDKGNVVNLEDVIIALITIDKPDGNHCYNDLVRDGNELHYTLTSQSINVPGICSCTIELTFKDGSFLGIPGFTIMAYEKYLSDKYIKSTNEYKGVTAQIVLAKGYADEASVSAQNSAASAEKAGKSEVAALKHKEDTESLYNEFQTVKKTTDDYIGEALTTIEDSRVEVANNNIITQKNTEAVSMMKQSVEISADAVEQKATEILNDTNLAKKYADEASVSAQNSAESEEKADKSKKAALQHKEEVNALVTTCEQLKNRCEALATECNNLYTELVNRGFLELGTSHTTAYYGDLGQIAYKHSQATGNPHLTTYTDVGADAAGAAQIAYENAVAYTDQMYAKLVNGAPTTLDTIGEIAEAFENNADVVEALDAAIGRKANAEEVESLINKLDERTSKLEDMIGYPIG